MSKSPKTCRIDDTLRKAEQRILPSQTGKNVLQAGGTVMQPVASRYLGVRYEDVEKCVDHIIDELGNDIRIGMPLGLGKPAVLINALYQRVKKNQQINLTIFTALSLEVPSWASDLERRLLEPFVRRYYAKVPNLDYMTDLRKGTLPANVKIHELYFRAGAYRSDPKMQQDYMSTNYTHTHRDCAANGVNCFMHMIAKSETETGPIFSCSCNADTSVVALHGFAEAKKVGIKTLTIGVVNSHLPFMYGEAEVPPELYDIIIDDPRCHHPLFGTPRPPISAADFVIGLHISTLIKDGGTLQIGIGALGDSIAYGLLLRQDQNDAYNRLIHDSGIAATYGPLIKEVGGTGTFTEGLYGSTEMLVDGFLQLYKGDVIKRKVYHHIGIQRLVNEGKVRDEIPSDILKLMIDQETIHPYLTKKDFEALQRFGVFKAELHYKDGHIVTRDRCYSPNLADAGNLKAVSQECLGDQLKSGVLLTGAFFVGPSEFYEMLRNMSEEERRQFEMTGVDVANQLYGGERLRSLERKHARFCNTGMKATLLGAIVSDGLEDGTVISGVGGQYNFVAMAHALPDARLLMMVKSTRQEGGKILSNIVYSYGHVTIPRHLRDIVVTEYGIADIRGKCDEEIIKAMLNVADSRFQDELLAEAKRHRKISEDYQIPEQFRNNTPERLSERIDSYKAEGLFPNFPFGSAFTDVELMIAHALRVLKTKGGGPGEAEISGTRKQLPTELPESLKPCFERMNLTNATMPEEIHSQRMLMLAFKLAGFL